MSDTPRTDEAKAMATVPFEKPEVILVTECVPADFSRQLERELAAVKEAFESSKKVAIIASAKLADTRAELAAAKAERGCSDVAVLNAELAAARANGAAYRNDYLFSQDRLKKAEAENKALREDAERWRWWRRWWCDAKDDMEVINALDPAGDSESALDAAIDAERAK